MFPEAFKERIRSQKYIDAESLLNALQEPAPVSIRINSRKWMHSPANSEPVPWCGNGFYLDKRPSFTTDPLFHSGCYYPQEASGMFLEQVFRQAAGDQEYIRVLDLCGAPGGKSTHLSSLIGEKGLLVSNEVIRSRASVLAENLTKWGLSNAIVTQSDPSAFSALQGFFDIVLVDAPCSGEGMFRDKIAVSEWSSENALHCSERQKRILMDIWPALKEDGILIYSTCTFNPGENEKNIKWLAQKHEAETIEINISDFKGVTEIDYEGIMGYGFYPGKIRGEGLFISALRKKGRQSSTVTKYKGDTRIRLTAEEKKIAAEWTNFSVENMIKSGDRIYAFPGDYNDYLTLSKSLRFIKQGTAVCSVKRTDFLPDHELAMSVYLKKGSFPILNLDTAQALAFLRRDSLALNDAPRGWTSVSFNNVIIGFLNNIGNRANNYYPVDWRIRMNISENLLENTLKWEV
jgi:16S rRNA C967 or C1407 C5-methylase (RsmB/RsmF family)/NOL1/NOP2/fmu family ribosome biogenesis protein